MTVQSKEFMQLITFNKQERAAALSRDTGGIISVYLEPEGDTLKFDVTGTGCSVEIASRQVAAGKTLPETSRIILRDHAECKNYTKYSGDLKHALIVGIVSDNNGSPVLTFEANKLKIGWQITCKKYRFTLDGEHLYPLQ